MKGYLNKEERAILIKVAILSGYIEDLANCEIGKEEKKYFKTAFTYLNKASGFLFGRLDLSFAEKVRREIYESELILVTKARAKIEYAEKEKIDNAINTLIDSNLGDICSKCDGKVENCKIKEAYKALGVPIFEKEKGICPYRITVAERK